MYGCAYTGATQEALVEQYNDQLRELREAGLTEQAEEVRETLRALRDEERAPEASVKVDCATYCRSCLCSCTHCSIFSLLQCIATWQQIGGYAPLRTSLGSAFVLSTEHLSAISYADLNDQHVCHLELGLMTTCM